MAKFTPVFPRKPLRGKGQLKRYPDLPRTAPGNIFWRAMNPQVRVRIPVLLFCLLGFYGRPVAAQTGATLAAMKQSADDLFRQLKYTEALPLLENIVAADPGDAEMRFHLGFALIAQGSNTKDAVQRKALRVRARTAFVKAKELGVKEPVVDALIASLPPDGSDAAVFSPNIEANALMTEAEALFGQGKLDASLLNYQKALELDPKLYHAALFAADTFIQKGDFAQGEAWYQRAIMIDPTRETAYRYSATPFMRQSRFDAARDRYVEAFITEPYNQYTLSGLLQWAQATNTNLAHPKIDLPTDVTFDEQGSAKVNLDPRVLGDKDTGAAAWVAYGLARSKWKQGQFARTFSKETAYRHSLPEEAEGLRSVLALATSDPAVKKLSPALTKLKKLNDEGLLEAYLLMAMADRGLAQDHPAYLMENRDKLRRYMMEYVLKGGGN